MIQRFLLLLLICSLSTVQLQSLSDHDVVPVETETETKDQGQDTVTDPDQQQNQTPDIHAVLREMSAALAEHRVEIRFLQKDSEAKQKQLESQKSEVDKLKQQLQAKVTEMESQKSEMNTLKQQLQAQAAELITFEQRSNITEIKVEALQKNEEVKQVAFSASLLASGSVTIGPFNTYTNLAFKHVFSNIGNAYNPDSGFFVAPVRGAYHFEFYIGANGHASNPSGAVLVKNGNHVCIAYEYQTSGFVKGANGVTLILEVGDVVYLRLWINTRLFENNNRHNTFSGHLLFTM